MSIDNNDIDKPTPRGTRVETPTLKTIAKLVGLAVPTVSRALHDAPDISQATRKKVRKVADEIGYVPNRAGVRLRTGKTNVISLILAADHDAMNHTARLIYSLGHELRGTRFHLNITPYFPDEDPMKSIRYVVETRSADAVILNQTQPHDPRVAYLMEKRFPFVTHGRTSWADDHAYFDYDNEKFGEIAMGKLARRGRKKILLLAPPMDQCFAQHMASGVRKAGERSGIEVILMEAITSDDKSADIKEAFQSYFRSHPDTDGIICGSTTGTMSAISGAELLGLQVGSDFDVVAKEAIPFLRQFRDKILTVPEDVGQAGSFLAQAAINAIHHPEGKSMQRLVAPTAEDTDQDTSRRETIT